MRSPMVIAVLVLSSSVASADYPESAPVRPLTMSDPAGLTFVGIDAHFAKWTEHPAPNVDIDVSAITFDFMADFAIAPHWVLLARLPLSKASIDDPALGDCCDLALGNVTLGGRGLWASRFPSGLRRVVGFEASLSAPTASDGGTRVLSAGAAALAQVPHDPGLYAPNTTTVRLTLLSQLYGQRLFAHGELGLQLFFYDSDAPGDDDLDLAIRAALSIGVRASYKVAILAELSSLLLANGFAGDNDTVSSLDIGVRYGSNAALFGLRLYLPLDPELRDLDMIGVGLDAGARF